jgi:GAF domain-containing protein
MTTKAERYSEVADELRLFLEGERDIVANAANLAALLYRELPQINWVGVYLHRGDELVVGPFQGPPACTRIGMGKGVCGTAAQRRETVVVEDVRKFPGHIACDPAARSEIVAPMIKDGRLLGVLDLDSPIVGRFDNVDRAGLEQLVQVFLESIE